MQVQNAGRSSLAGGARKAEAALKRTNSELQSILEKLTTAKRINRASDDAAGLAVSEQLQTNIRGFKVASQNITDAMSALNIADSVTNETTSVLLRQRELALSSRNGTLNDTDRQALDVEYQQLSRELDRLASGGQFNRQDVTSGNDLASGTAVIQAGAGPEEQIVLPRIDLKSVSAGIGVTSVSSADNAAAALTALDDALKTVNTQRSNVGSVVNRLESSIDNLSVAMVNTQAAESVLRDEDMAKGLADLTRAQILQEGSIRAFSRFNEINKNHILGLLS